MLHPALARALATAHTEDLDRAVARRWAIRFARRVAHERTVEENSPLHPEVLDTGVEDKSLELDGTTPLVGS